MPSATIYFSEDEHKIITFYSKKWNLAQYETVRRIIIEFMEKDKGGKN